MTKKLLKTKQIAVLLIIITIISVTMAIIFTQEPVLVKSENPALVIIRIDDIQDYAFKEAQEFLLQFGQENNIPLSLAVIPNYFGNDQEIVQKVKESIKFGSEIAAHGLNHENLSQYSFSGQKTLLLEAKNKLTEILDYTPKLLIPPMFSYNNNTLKAMKETGYGIVSGLTEFNQYGWITDKIRSIPATIELSKYTENNWQMKTTTQILNELNESITDFGYAVIVTHPQEFYNRETFEETKAETFIKMLDTISEIYSFCVYENLEPKLK